jgi:hypothetical protein
MLLSSPRPIGELSREQIRRFWSRVDRKREGCWEWQGLRTEDGYGRAWLHGTIHRAHRVAWAAVEGDLPGVMVLHTCDNPPCCRPSHLFLGDARVNSHDARAKGRLVKPPDPTGERNPSAILTEETVSQIKALEAWPRADVAECFGVSKSCLQDIYKGRTWAHVPGHADF